MPLTLATINPGEPEIFASEQGEGASAGKMCAFIRLSQCNLACVWCDTAYTWLFDGRFDEADTPHRDGVSYNRAANQITMSEQDAAARIAALGQNRLVITGGEPLLQASALARMIAQLPHMQVEVETNGSVAPIPALDALVHQYNVSPKLAHSGNPSEKALVPAMMLRWASDPRAWFKFVIERPEDVNEVLVLQATYGFPSQRVFLMPEGRNSETLRTRLPWLAELCSQYGFLLTDRLHIHRYGDTRGT